MDLNHVVPESDTVRVYQARDRRVELKFILPKALSNSVRNWAKERMDPDPHCQTFPSDSYEIHTLYLDTSSLDIYRKTGVAGLTKHRLRCYGNESNIWVETKRKKNNIVLKKRSTISAEELEFIHQPHSAESLWTGAWFQQRVLQKNLQPTALVHYQRFAQTARHQNRTIRLTIDSQLTGCRSSLWEVPNRAPRWTSLSPEIEILELKFHNVLPPLFKKLLLEFPILSTGFSKYRTVMAASECIASQPASL
ncbi:VTC domain protein [Gimesia alba]|uniref:VTC domain protein n=1 Tax=Gimesia alba TaxID=2527973 RepID=A0A517RD01_9PLAN|nr:polyphosphate polymerase domain-containing protein [Gimesia alba]QDT41723.1 VTC domain protein [Gimesia alba]